MCNKIGYVYRPELNRFCEAEKEIPTGSACFAPNDTGVGGATIYALPAVSDHMYPRKRTAELMLDFFLTILQNSTGSKFTQVLGERRCDLMKTVPNQTHIMILRLVRIFS